MQVKYGRVNLYNHIPSFEFRGLGSAHGSPAFVMMEYTLSTNLTLIGIQSAVPKLAYATRGPGLRNLIFETTFLDAISSHLA